MNHLFEQDQYAGIREIFQKCFVLLKVMARGNEAVQQRLFDRLDMLLNIQGAENQMAEALIEVKRCLVVRIFCILLSQNIFMVHFFISIDCMTDCMYSN